VTGFANIECTVCDEAYFCYNVSHWANLFLHGSAEWAEYSYDCITWWSPYSNHMYGVMWAWACEHVYMSIFVNWWSYNIYYSINLDACSYCLGCIWLKNKYFCILNKQYTKEERFEKANQIFEQMDNDWILWDFFPPSMNPFYFNDTAAYLIDDSFTKEEVEKEWYLRRNEEIKVDIPEWLNTIKTKELNNFQWFDSEWNRKINPDILKKVIIDKKWNSYRIVKMEYDFLMKYWLPLPEIHWLDRIKLGFKFK
jgi:hypothetical protein